MQNFDVLIIGSGLAGQSAALRLATHCRVALVSKRTLEATRQSLSDISRRWSIVSNLHPQDFTVALEAALDTR